MTHIAKEHIQRIPKEHYYLSIAETVSKRSTCMIRQYGAVIVHNDHIVSTGYNGAPRGRVNCIDRGICFRLEHNIPRGTRYEMCRSIHGELNAIINASPDELEGSTLYLYGYDLITQSTVPKASCCAMCKRAIINAGIGEVIIADPEFGLYDEMSPYRARVIQVADWIVNDDSLDPAGGY